ncbi:MAG: hypothetical protein ACE5IZ_06595 [Dehalococcoidia bacterium]
MRSSSAGWLLGRSRWAGVVALLVVGAVSGWRPPSVGAHDLCANTGSSQGPFDVVAYEAKDWRQVYSDTLSLAAFDGLFPDDPYFGLPLMEKGPRDERDTAEVRYIPPVILKAIGWIESNWIQAWYDVPYGAIGPALISHDCGYGIMQVTSGMQNTTGTPTPQQLMVAAHYAYNIARGAWTLADKWNAAPEARPIVGDGDPAIVEDWYYAVWSYNGFAFKNHPLNPAYSEWPRPSFSCGPPDDGLGHDRSQYPYQELVFGCMGNPPQLVVEEDEERLPLWQPQEATLPDLGLEEVFNAMLNFFVFQDEKMDIPRPESSHTDPSELAGEREAIVGAPQMAMAARDFTFQLFKDGTEPATDAEPIEIRNLGTGQLVWMAVPSASWIVVSPPQGIALGSDLGDLASAFTVTVNAVGLEPGHYQGTVTVVAPFTAADPTAIDVGLTVFDRAFLPGVFKE